MVQYAYTPCKHTYIHTYIYKEYSISHTVRYSQYITIQTHTPINTVSLLVHSATHMHTMQCTFKYTQTALAPLHSRSDTHSTLIYTPDDGLDDKILKLDYQMASVSKCSSVLMYSQNARRPLYTWRIELRREEGSERER